MRLMLAISAGEWEGIKHRPHHLMKRSAKSGWTVIYLEPPATLIGPLKNKKMLLRWKNWLKGLRKAEDNLYLLSPPPILPFYNKYRFINKINQYLISRLIKKALKDFKGVPLDFYSFLPWSVDLIRFLNIDKLIYDCVDDHSSFTGLINAETVARMEKELMRKADVSFATARQLMEDRKDWSGNFHLVPNGAEFEHFANIIEEDNSIPADIAEIKHPIAGFYGGIGDWIDITLLTNVASKISNVNFVFIGPVTTNVDKLKSLPNVTFLGVKPYTELPRYIQQFDTCLVPFKINKLTESVNPIKLYEYLSAGKPVVATALKEVIQYQEVVEIINNQQEMIDRIYKTLDNKEKIAEKVLKRQQVGKDNSWDVRWQLIERQIKLAGTRGEGS